MSLGPPEKPVRYRPPLRLYNRATRDYLNPESINRAYGIYMHKQGKGRVLSSELPQGVAHLDGK